MGIEISRCHWAKCDECGRIFGEDDGSESHYDSDSELVEALKGNKWDVQDDKVLCPECKVVIGN